MPNKQFPAVHSNAEIYNCCGLWTIDCGLFVVMAVKRTRMAATGRALTEELLAKADDYKKMVGENRWMDGNHKQMIGD